MLRQPYSLAGLGSALLLAALGLASRLPDTRLAQGLLVGAGGGLLFSALLRRLHPDSCDASTAELNRRDRREFIPAMAAYVVLLALSIWLLKRVDAPILRALVALIPVAPIALVLRAVIRHIRDTDEMQRQIELEAVSCAAAAVSLLYMSGGLLQKAGVIDVPSGAAMIWVFPLVCLVYGVAKGLVARRYR